MSAILLIKSTVSIPLPGEDCSRIIVALKLSLVTDILLHKLVP